MTFLWTVVILAVVAAAALALATSVHTVRQYERGVVLRFAVRPAPHQGSPARPDLPPAVPDRPADPGQHPDRHHVGPGPGWHHPGQRVRDRGRRRLLPGRRPGEGRGPVSYTHLRA